MDFPTMDYCALHLCNHLEEGEGDDLLRDVDHLVKPDSHGGPEKGDIHTIFDMKKYPNMFV